jgi:hypothetical protein
MKQQSDLTAWLVELIKRFGQKSPKFFVILQWVGFVCALITGVPELLLNAGIELPAAFHKIASETVAIAALIMSLISKLPVVHPDQHLRQLPFTAKKPVSENTTPQK